MIENNLNFDSNFDSMAKIQEQLITNFLNKFKNTHFVAF